MTDSSGCSRGQLWQRCSHLFNLCFHLQLGQINKIQWKERETANKVRYEKTNTKWNREKKRHVERLSQTEWKTENECSMRASVLMADTEYMISLNDSKQSNKLPSYCMFSICIVLFHSMCSLGFPKSKITCQIFCKTNRCDPLHLQVEPQDS